MTAEPQREFVDASVLVSPTAEDVVAAIGLHAEAKIGFGTR